MYLIINAAKLNEVELTIFDSENVFRYKRESKNRDLLHAVADFLAELKMNANDLQGVAAVSGGSFTSTRLSSVITNMFGHFLNLPVMSVTPEEVPDLQELAKKFQACAPHQLMQAVYSGEPNINRAAKPLL